VGLRSALPKHLPQRPRPTFAIWQPHRWHLGFGFAGVAGLTGRVGVVIMIASFELPSCAIRSIRENVKRARSRSLEAIERILTGLTCTFTA
jgi:hypothetical protein